MSRVLAGLVGALLGVFLFTSAAAAAPGAPDRSFSGNGFAITGFGGFVSSAEWGGLDSKRRIVAVGFSRHRTQNGDKSTIAIARYTRHGHLDPTFAGDGKEHYRLEPRNAFAHAGAIDGRGRILAGGGRCDDPTFEKGCVFVVARLKPNGANDRSFSGDGHTVTAFPDNAVITSMALDHGKIVVAGYAGDRIALARYTRHGRLDPSFGTGGTVTLDGRAGEFAESMAIDRHGRIVVPGGPGWALTRLKPDGQVDQRFGHGGTVTTDFKGYDRIEAIAIGKRSRIVGAGSSQHGIGGDRRYRFAVARYRPDGKLDRSFSHDGKTKTTFSGFRDEATAVTIDSRGRVVAAGYATSFELAIARYEPDGSLDRSFGNDGMVRDGRIDTAIPSSVLTDRRDRVVPLGYFRGQFGVARYIGYRHG